MNLLHVRRERKQAASSFGNQAEQKKTISISPLSVLNLCTNFHCDIKATNGSGVFCTYVYKHLLELMIILMKCCQCLNYAHEISQIAR